MARLVSRAEFSRLAGVSDAMVSKLCRPGGKLSPAGVGRRIDVDHDSAADYLRSKGVDPTKVEPSPAVEPEKPAASRRRADGGARQSKGAGERTGGRAGARRAAKSPEPVAVPDPGDDPEDIERLADRTLRWITDNFGTKTAFKDYLEARKRIADIREKELKNAETEGRLISRDLVQTHVFGTIEALTRRLLGDEPKTLAQRVYSMARAGEPIEEAEKVIRDGISSQIKPVKLRVVRTLREAGE